MLSNCGSIKVKYLRLNVTRLGKVRQAVVAVCWYRGGQPSLTLIS